MSKKKTCLRKYVVLLDISGKIIITIIYFFGSIFRLDMIRLNITRKYWSNVLIAVAFISRRVFCLT